MKSVKEFLIKIKDRIFGDTVSRFEKRVKRIQTKLDKMCVRAGVTLVAVKMPDTNRNFVSLSFVPTKSLNDKRDQEGEMLSKRLQILQRMHPQQLLRLVPKKFKEDVKKIMRERGFNVK